MNDPGRTRSISFGDRVRVRSTPETEAAGYAGLVGECQGFTTPSVTGIAVVGTPTDDYAFSVDLAGLAEQVWFAPDLLEFVDHRPGTQLRIDGVPRTWVRREDGGWDVVDDPHEAP